VVVNASYRYLGWRVARSTRSSQLPILPIVIVNRLLVVAKCGQIIHAQLLHRGVMSNSSLDFCPR